MTHPFNAAYKNKIKIYFKINKAYSCVTVSRVVISDTTGVQFKSTRWKNFITNIFLLAVEKTKIKKKGPGVAHVKNKAWVAAVAQSIEWSHTSYSRSRKWLGLVRCESALLQTL